MAFNPEAQSKNESLGLNDNEESRLEAEINRREDKEPEVDPQENINAEKTTSETGETTPEIIDEVTEENVREELSSENQGLFDKMSTGGKKIMQRAGEDLLEKSVNAYESSLNATDQVATGGKKVMNKVAEDWHEKSVKIYEGSIGVADRTFRAGDDALEKGKKVAGAIYDGLYKIPWVNRIIGKMEISHNQRLISEHEKEAVQAKKQMDKFNVKIKFIDGEKGKIENVIEDLKKKGMSTESMQARIKKLELQRNELFNQQNKAQSRVEQGENKAKMYTNKRDAIADKLIGRYNEKLQPIEGKLEDLKNNRDELELQLSITEDNHKKELAELNSIKKSKEEYVELLKGLGDSEKEIAKDSDIKEMDERLTQGYEKMRTEKGLLMIKLNKLDDRIAKLDEKAAPTRDQREEMIRVKEDRPIKFDVKERKERADFTDREEANIHTRKTEAGNIDATAAPATENVAASEASESFVSEDGGESVEQEMEMMWTTKELLTNWNNHLEERYGNGAINEKIDPEKFFKTIERMGSNRNNEIDAESFRNILKAYCKFKKMPMAEIDNRLDIFFEDKMAAGE